MTYYLKKRNFISILLVTGYWLLVTSPAAHAQYLPGMPGKLGVGAVSQTGIEWTFSLGGSLANEVQLFVGNDTAPKITIPADTGTVSIFEGDLEPNTRYAARRIRAVYYGVGGALSAEFPAAYTLARVPSLAIEPIIGSPNIQLSVSESFRLGEGVSGWQVYDVLRRDLRDWVGTYTLQLPGGAPGEGRVFKVRARNAEGLVTDWSESVSYIYEPIPIASPEPSVETVNASSPLPTLTVNANVAALRVRNQPSLSGLIIGRVHGGQSHPVLAEQDGWYRIPYQSREGWVFGGYVSVH
ncbi:MAG: SH3 domain-containing protein [bacterium]|nr:SH3 domain-containing protein [bacterium]